MAVFAVDMSGCRETGEGFLAKTKLGDRFSPVEKRRLDKKFSPLVLPHQTRNPSPIDTAGSIGHLPGLTPTFRVNRRARSNPLRPFENSQAMPHDAPKLHQFRTNGMTAPMYTRSHRRPWNPTSSLDRTADDELRQSP
jgi:hypothetical protein